MLNPTRLMHVILTSEEAQLIIDYMSPIYGEARVFLWLLQAIGTALDEANTCRDDFDAQSQIATATWSLPYYEDEYGIVTNSTLSDEQRRKNIFSAIRFKVPLNPYKVSMILSAVGGTKVTIEENTGKNRFTVHTDYTDLPAEMEKFINMAKPAHTICDFEIEGLVTTKVKVSKARQEAIYEYKLSGTQLIGGKPWRSILGSSSESDVNILKEQNAAEYAYELTSGLAAGTIPGRQSFGNLVTSEADSDFMVQNAVVQHRVCGKANCGTK